MARDIPLMEAAMRSEAGSSFDLWLHGALSKQFGGADAERVPDELLSLLPSADEDETP